MKNLLLLVLILYSKFAVAQIHFGLKAGPSASTIHQINPSIPSASNDYGVLLSYHMGVFSQLKFTDRFSINSELLFSGKGFRYAEESSPNELFIRFTYLSLPILFGFHPTDKLTLKIGPEVGYLVGSGSKFGFKKGDISKFWDNKTEMSFALGIHHVITSRISAELRYNHAFTAVQKTIYTDEQGNIEGESKNKNRAALLSICYRIL